MKTSPSQSSAALKHTATRGQTTVYIYLSYVDWVDCFHKASLNCTGAFCFKDGKKHLLIVYIVDGAEGSSIFEVVL